MAESASAAREAIDAIDAIDAASRAVRERHDEVALAAALRAWRLVRLPALADAIDALSVRVDAASRRPKGATAGARHLAWLEVAAKNDPADVAALMATLLEGTFRPSTEKIEALAKKESDPRIAMPLAMLIAEPGARSSSSWRQFWDVALEIVKIAADERAIRYFPIIDRILRIDLSRGSRRKQWLSHAKTLEAATAIEANVAAVRAIKGITAIEEAAAKLASELAGAKGTQQRSATDLFAQVYETPHDDSAKAVLADVLQELGDPRGEFISLQLAASSTTSKPSKREKSLFKEHATAWLEPLAEVVIEESAVFEKGFLASCAVHCRHQPIADAVLLRPEWATVRSIALGGRAGRIWQARVNSLLMAPTMKSLREISRVAISALASVTEPVRLTKVHTMHCGSFAVDSLEKMDDLFPDLFELDVGTIAEYPPFVDRLMKLAIIRRQSTLSCSATDERWKVSWLKTAQERAREDDGFRPTVIRVNSSNERGEWRWALTRDKQGALSIVDACFIHKGVSWDPWSQSTSPLDEVTRIVGSLSSKPTQIRVSVDSKRRPPTKVIETLLSDLRKNCEDADFADFVARPTKA